MRRQAGFSLVEVLVVVVIIGILAGVVLPKMTDFFSEADLDNAAMEMELFFRRVRQEALRNHARVCYVLDLSNDRIERAWVDFDQNQAYSGEDNDSELAISGFEMPGAVDLATSVDGTTGTFGSCLTWHGTVTGDDGTIQVGYLPYETANYANWRSWTFQDVSGFYRSYPCGRNAPFAANDC